MKRNVTKYELRELAKSCDLLQFHIDNHELQPIQGSACTYEQAMMNAAASLARQNSALLGEVAAARAEIAEIRALVLQSSEPKDACARDPQEIKIQIGESIRLEPESFPRALDR